MSAFNVPLILLWLALLWARGGAIVQVIEPKPGAVIAAAALTGTAELNLKYSCMFTSGEACFQVLAP
jgi:hypothetical protein